MACDKEFIVSLKAGAELIDRTYPYYCPVQLSLRDQPMRNLFTGCMCNSAFLRVRRQRDQHIIKRCRVRRFQCSAGICVAVPVHAGESTLVGFQRGIIQAMRVVRKYRFPVGHFESTLPEARRH